MSSKGCRAVLLILWTASSCTFACSLTDVRYWSPCEFAVIPWQIGLLLGYYWCWKPCLRKQYFFLPLFAELEVQKIFKVVLPAKKKFSLDPCTQIGKQIDKIYIYISDIQEISVFACSCMCLCENRLGGSCTYAEICVGKTDVSLPHFLIGELLL